MIDFRNPDCMAVRRLKMFMARHMARFKLSEKEYTFHHINWVSDGMNGRIPDGEIEYSIEGILGNFSQTFRRVMTDGGTANYNQGQSLYLICMYDPDIPWQVGDTMVVGNITYFITEFINIQELDLYWYVTLNFTDTNKEFANYG